MSGYDVIGDIHGHADALERLLAAIGLPRDRRRLPAPGAPVVFLGDLIDRGPGQLPTLDIARRMVDAGAAWIVLGNHEFNAVAWATRNDADEWCRPHSDKNRRQHSAFLEAVGENSVRHQEWIRWFETLPMWLDLEALRIVHACWHPASMRVLGGTSLNRDIITAAPGDPLHEALEVVLKGPEIHMAGRTYADKDGNCREWARLRWWDPTATTLATAAEIPGGATTCDGAPLPPLPDTPLGRDALPELVLDKPVLYGHYWRSGPQPAIDNPRAACLDWSIAKGGRLVAYRWSGETELTNDNLVAVR